MSDDKLTPAEMRLFCLGAALYGANMEGAKIIADALEEMHANRRKTEAKKPPAKRRKKR